MTISGKRVWLRALLALALLVFLLSHFSPVKAEDPVWITMNERLTVAAGEEKVFQFTATSNNLYQFQSFGNIEAEAALYTDGGQRLIAEAHGFSFEARLTRGETYLLSVKAGALAGDLQVEIMRAAFGRYFDRPIQLMVEEAPYKKMIAQPYDTHWYQFIAGTGGLYSIHAQSDINTHCYLLDENGETVDFDDAFGPAFAKSFYLQANLKSGCTYYLRISAESDAVGDYALYVRPPNEGEDPATGIDLETSVYTLFDGEQANLEYRLTPPGAQADVLFVSSDPSVVSVSADGELTARGSGEAEVALIAGQGIYAAAKVDVSAVMVENLSFSEESVRIRAGQTYAAEVEISPSNASNRAVSYYSSAPDIATVDNRGVITAIEQGKAEISAVSQDGGLAAQLTVYVGEPAPEYRALIVGERQYSDGRIRLGSVNTTQGIYDLLSNLSYEGEKYKITMRMDVSRGYAISQIRQTFKDAKETDVSLFYINCHGSIESGTAYIEFSDTKRMTAEQLERELRRIPGTVIVIIDCCNSGGFISGDAERYNRYMIQAFENGGATPLTKSKYLVMTSTASIQDSHRVRYGKSDNEDMNATAFSVSLCESGGWDLIKDRRISFKADLRSERIVTFNDVYIYTRRRVHQLLSKEQAEQDVQVYPEGSNFPIFMRN